MTADGASRTRVLLVGAGRRARQTILPAIWACDERVDLVGVCARSAREIELLGGRFRTTTTTLPNVDLSGVDVVVVAIGTRSVPGLLRELAGRSEAASLTLMLDTPGLAAADLGAASLFDRFASVLASEDNYALPLFVLARRLVDEGAIGALRRVYLVHSGYRHHAIAALKQLTGAQHPTSVAIDRWTGFASDIRIRFPGDVRALIVEPRRYGSGRTMIVGERAFVTDYPVEHPKAIQVGYRMEDGTFRGLTVDGEPAPASDLDAAFAARLGGAPLEDPTLMGQMKIRGLMELLCGAHDPRSRFRYPVHDAIADDLSIRFAERLPFAVTGRPAVVRSAARLTARFVRSGGDEH